MGRTIRMTDGERRGFDGSSGPKGRKVRLVRENMRETSRIRKRRRNNGKRKLNRAIFRATVAASFSASTGGTININPYIE